MEARYGAKVEESKSWEPVIHANAYSAPALPIIRVQQPETIVLSSWGLIYWVKSEPNARKLHTMTINARFETAFDKPSCRGAAKSGQRCLIPVSGHDEMRLCFPFGKVESAVPPVGKEGDA